MKCEICKHEFKCLNKHLHLTHKFSYKEIEEYYDTYIEPNKEHLCLCGKKLKFLGFKYAPTCGDECCKHKQISRTCLLKYGNSCGANGVNIPKSKHTKFLKYGDENYNNRELAEETCFERYGVRKILSSIEKIEKGRQTKLQKYGDVNYNNRKLAEETCIERYGVRHHFQNKDIFDKCKKKIHKYGKTFDSSWEVIYYDYLMKNHIKFVYHPNVELFYSFNGKIHRYYPDFLVNDEFVEIKGDHLLNEMKKQNTLENAKYNCMIDNNVKILTGKEIEEIYDKIKIKEME